MSGEEREVLETKFRILASMYFRMSIVLSSVKKGGNLLINHTKLEDARQAISEYLRTSPEISEFTHRNIAEFEEKVRQITAGDFDRTAVLEQFYWKLVDLACEFAGRTIDIRDKTFECPPCRVH